MTGLNILTWLTADLDECGRSDGEPFVGPDLERFLPGTQAPQTPKPGHSRPGNHHSAVARTGRTSNCCALHGTSEYLC